MAEKKEKLDFLTKLRIRELILMGLITITAVMANLPHEYVQDTLGVSQHVGEIFYPLACLLLDPCGSRLVADGAGRTWDLPVADVPYEHVPEGVLALAFH